MPFPSLMTLDVNFQDPRLFQNSLELFPKHSPDIRRLFIRVYRYEDRFVKIERSSSYMRRWQNLLSVECPHVALDMYNIIHLSRMPTLTQLNFMLSPTLSAPDSPLIFSNLYELTLHSGLLEQTLCILSQTRLPVITHFTTWVGNYPSRKDLSSCLVSLLTSNPGHTIESLRLYHFSEFPDNVVRSETLPLGFEDMRPCMGFSNLRHMELVIVCNVDLTDSHILTLPSAWPKLEHLLINEDLGWNTTGGITPGGLVRLLQTCPLLNWIVLRLDTRGYTEAPANLGLTLPSDISLNVLDSIIEEESVPVVATFFCHISAACSESDFDLCAWSTASETMMGLPNMKVYAERWKYVRDEVYDAHGWSSDSDCSDVLLI
ncbi:hypothetical protein OG21DRAFT_1014701 [Imleria badia]|nr:hypothetical protein OG21DRAFT_1014701 [Imleria badia]